MTGIQKIVDDFVDILKYFASIAQKIVSFKFCTYLTILPFSGKA